VWVKDWNQVDETGGPERGEHEGHGSTPDR